VSLQEKLEQAEEQLAKTATQGGGNSEDLKADNEKLRALVTVGQDASRQQEQLIEQLQKELTAAKTSSTNGPVNEEQCQEDDSLQGDTASLVSASSASVTDPNSSQSQSEAPTKKPKKKRKGASAAQ